MLDMPLQKVIASGIVDRIGLSNSMIHYKTEDIDVKENLPMPNHKVGLSKIAQLLLDKKNGVINEVSEIKAIGHRVVHGGSHFSQTTLIDEDVKAKIKAFFSLAPLHNPPNLEGIVLTELIFPNAIQVAVFDTAFHQTIPQIAHKYAIPNELYEKHEVRLFGFHGTSHKYVSDQATQHLKNKNLKMITIHLGNGCSMTAIRNGKSIDHTLGFGPSNGLIMGTRSGDIDHSIIFYLVNTLGYTLNEVNELLNKKSGMFGLTGFADLREIQTAASEGNKNCQLALDMNAYRIQKYIGAYCAVLNGLDTIVFTGGIGENSSILRAKICTNLEYLGIKLDKSKNNINNHQINEINEDSSPVKILVIPTNEELEIAKSTYEICNV